MIQPLGTIKLEICIELNTILLCKMFLPAIKSVIWGHKSMKSINVVGGCEYNYVILLCLAMPVSGGFIFLFFFGGGGRSIPPPLKPFKQYFLETQSQSIGLYTDCMTRGVVYLIYKHNESESSSSRLQLYICTFTDDI